MNLAPIYELRSRLRASMIAGTNLISEDFRLKRAVEEIKPLEALSPVFARIGQLAASLLSESCEGKEAVLMDAITLVDALLCTQGLVAVADEVEPIVVNGCGSVITNAPYSVVKGLVEALTTSGNGHFQFVIDTHEEKPKLFGDYRVKAAMISALGAGYAELAEQVTKWLKQEGGEILPLLQKGFDPKGKKEMVRRVQVMEAVAGGKCNDFYIKNICEAERDVKNELIYALRYNQENVELLLELTKKEKGNARKMAYYALAEMEDERAEKVFRELYEKKPMDAMLYLRMTTTGWASKLVGESLMKMLTICREPDYGKGEKVFEANETEQLAMIIKALSGKDGEEICEAYRMASMVPEIYYSTPKDKKINIWKMHIPVRRTDYRRLEQKNFAEVMAYFLETAIRLKPGEDLCGLAMELYEKKDMADRNSVYFQAAVAARLLGKEDCSGWLREQIFVKGLIKEKKRKDLGEALGLALKGLVYDAERGGYYLQTLMQDDANEVLEAFEQQITQELGGAFMDSLIEYCSEDVDREMIHFVNKDDEECRKKLEEYFYKRALTGPTDSLKYYWKGLKVCGCERCEGLFVEYIMRNNGKEMHGWAVCQKLWELPGTAEAFEKEAEAVYQMICNGKVKVRYWNGNENIYKEYIEIIKAKKRERF